MLMRVFAVVAVAIVMAGCSGPTEDDFISAVVVADGDEKMLTFASIITVEEMLSSAGINLGARDRVSHLLSLPIADGMRVTVRRVRETQDCLRENLPYERTLVAYEAIPPGEERLARAGRDGMKESCYRIVLEDNVETERTLIRQPIVIQQPQDEIVYVGPSNLAPNMQISGRLSYINNGTVWTILGNAAQKRLLSATEGLDSLVLSQNSRGSHLLYTATAGATDEFLNELWLLDFSFDTRPVKLPPGDVLYAEWRPGSSYEIAYSTAEAALGGLGWRALNNLWLMQIDPLSGRARSIEEIVPESRGGAFGWWGTAYRWSPQGDQMAWANPESVGVIDFERKRLVPLADYAAFDSSQSWVWLSSLAWSHDSRFVASVTHGSPLGSEPPESSPVFDLAVTRADGAISAIVRSSVGMWSGPSFSPRLPGAEVAGEQGYLAWMQARYPHNSNNSEYDLMVADRDGSNQRRLFPAAGSARGAQGQLGIQRERLDLEPRCEIHRADLSRQPLAGRDPERRRSSDHI